MMAPAVTATSPADQLSAIVTVYEEQIAGGGGGNNSNNSKRNVMKLELEQYLEKTLWPTFTSALEEEKGDDQPNSSSAILSSKHLLLSIVAMVNEKFRERATVWPTFQQQSSAAAFSRLFSEVTRLTLNTAQLNIRERTALLRFLIHCFNSVEVELVRSEIQKYISMPIWCCLTERRRTLELARAPRLKKFWRKLERADEKLPEGRKAEVAFERRFLARLIDDYFALLASVPGANGSQQRQLKREHREVITYLERFLELLTDLEALLPTRRFFNALLDDRHVLTISRLSPLYTTRSSAEGKLFSQLLDRLRFYLKFEIDDVSGEALTEPAVAARHFAAMTALQRTAFKLFGQNTSENSSKEDDPDRAAFRELYLASVSALDSRERLLKVLGRVEDETKLATLAAHLGLGLEENNSQEMTAAATLFPSLDRRTFLLELLADTFERRPSQLKALNSLPLYPSEEVIWDENLVPGGDDFHHFNGDSVLALPKLNVQFLTLHDYLLRNFTLFRLESTYEIRTDIEQAVAHLKPWRTEEGGVMFGGWARMAIPIDHFAVTELAKAAIGQGGRPSRVRAEVVVNLAVKRSIKTEWEALRRHDVAFLVTVRPEAAPGTPFNYREPFVPQVGLAFVRGCEIEGMLDPTGRLIDENPYAAEGRPHFSTDFRTYRVLLDTNQYQIDLRSGAVALCDSSSSSTSAGQEEVEGTSAARPVPAEELYESFNILVRRKPKANNFKAVLETIRELMNTRCVVPDWLHDVILGYGEPGAAHYSALAVNRDLFPVLDFYDTFLSLEHVQEVFGGDGYQVKVAEGTSSPPQPPFKLAIDEEAKLVTVTSYSVPSRGPFAADEPRRNSIRFTRAQVEAIRAGMQHGLTMVVGPPGTGKTDLAVQIISALYHNHPEQRTLVVTHSNAALNQIFEKIIALDVDERHLLRLGHGEAGLETEKDFSRYGRVNYVLAKRLELLAAVGRLATSLGLSTDAASTCETAGYFFLYHVLSKWEAFQAEMAAAAASEKTASFVAARFPFTAFFLEDLGRDLFNTEDSFETALEVASGCYRHLRRLFTQLEEFRAFEMLRPGPERANYLLVREAKIIAMTCTHAALKRAELVELAFQYDNILMEEAATVLEIETFLPLLLQNPHFGHNRLKRWIMIGDHQQLPPVIKNAAFGRFSNMEQSLFARFVRLGVPTITLDRQGRSRASIARLWSWRYQGLGNLQHVEELNEFTRPNPGFLYDFQLVNVEDFNGVGESEPAPHFYQNLAEAEFMVATFMYMRLLGYPAASITLLTTYNGQKHLLRDVVEQRCASNPFIGRPAKVTTVDKFQGQQSDYVLLSLVRTKGAVGHVRDIRRLTVAMSRARLGLYVFARERLFAGCYELARTFSLLKADRPTSSLQLLPAESFFDESFSRTSAGEDEVKAITTMAEMVAFVFEFYATAVARLQQRRPEEFERIMSGGGQRDGQTPAEEEEEEAVPATAEGEEEEEELPFEPLAEDDQAVDDDVAMDFEEEEEKVVKKVPPPKKSSVEASGEEGGDKEEEEEKEDEEEAVAAKRQKVVEEVAADAAAPEGDAPLEKEEEEEEEESTETPKAEEEASTTEEEEPTEGNEEEAEAEADE